MWEGLGVLPVELQGSAFLRTCPVKVSACEELLTRSKDCDLEPQRLLMLLCSCQQHYCKIFESIQRKTFRLPVKNLFRPSPLEKANHKAEHSGIP